MVIGRVEEIEELKSLVIITKVGIFDILLMELWLNIEVWFGL